MSRKARSDCRSLSHPSRCRCHSTIRGHGLDLFLSRRNFHLNRLSHRWIRRRQVRQIPSRCSNYRGHGHGRGRSLCCPHPSDYHPVRSRGDGRHGDGKAGLLAAPQVLPEVRLVCSEVPQGLSAARPASTACWDWLLAATRAQMVLL
ncbi:hypothetical protein [Acidisoma sp. L85]|uniref:hypothetical protein n=1 Tax=Acidisoma sp. L85 TaxID=1641850 RepID=UPI001C207D76|nr:hypothetical protein [Acidisoma sp. L85]